MDSCARKRRPSRGRRIAHNAIPHQSILYPNEIWTRNVKNDSRPPHSLLHPADSYKYPALARGTVSVREMDEEFHFPFVS